MADKSTFASSLSQSKHRSKRMLEFTCATANIEPFGIVKITSASTLLDEAGLVMTVVPATLSTDTDTGDASDTLIFGVNGPVRVRKNTVGTLSLDFPAVIAYDTENKDARKAAGWAGTAAAVAPGTLPHEAPAGGWEVSVDGKMVAQPAVTVTAVGR